MRRVEGPYGSSLFLIIISKETGRQAGIYIHSHNFIRNTKLLFKD